MTFKPKLGGLAALIAEEQAKKAEITKTTKSLESQAKSIYIPAEQARERYYIIFDDSCSMEGQKVKDAHAGTIEFMRNCVINDVAVGVYPMFMKPIPMDTDLPTQAALIPFIKADGGSTPLFETLLKAMSPPRGQAKATRYIVFSDGQPDSTRKMQECITRALDDKTPVDTVFITEGSDYGGALLKELADKTGGFYLCFDRNKVNFKDAFKYLAPKYRLSLSDGNFRKALEEGKIK